MGQGSIKLFALSDLWIGPGHPIIQGHPTGVAHGGTRSARGGARTCSVPTVTLAMKTHGLQALGLVPLIALSFGP